MYITIHIHVYIYTYAHKVYYDATCYNLTYYDTLFYTTHENTELIAGYTIYVSLLV